ncbi:MAG: hypothetical protein HY757_08510 [Nitrospirae bacterium]|nr:hypothetical protein [Nitrospirota bacterium]
MIHINRVREDENNVVIEPSQKWFESARAATETAIVENEDHDPDDDIYGHDEVRAALEKLFYDKCAYCESKIAATHDWNVEHFRPKGRVAKRSDHPGYYWLNYEWHNLYPVCTHCNQRRKDKPRWGDMRYADTQGKLDQFPLADEETRAMSHEDNISNESILLIDPCSDNPEDFLAYDVQGQIYAKDGNTRGSVTIDICHLKRKRLEDARREIIIFVVKLLKLINKYKSEGNTSAVRDIKKLLNDQLNDNCSYAGAARYVIEDPVAFGI